MDLYPPSGSLDLYWVLWATYHTIHTSSYHINRGTWLMFVHQTPHGRNVGRIQLCHFALPVSPTTHFSTSFHSLSTSSLLSPSHINITPPFSSIVISNSPVGAFQLIPRLQYKRYYTATAFHWSLMVSYTVTLYALCLKDRLTLHNISQVFRQTLLTGTKDGWHLQDNSSTLQIEFLFS